MSQNVAKNEHDKIGLVNDQENRECKHVPAFLTCIESYWINLNHVKMIQTRPSPALTCKAWNIELGTNSAVAQVLKARTSAHQSHNQPTGHHHLAAQHGQGMTGTRIAGSADGMKHGETWWNLWVCWVWFRVGSPCDFKVRVKQNNVGKGAFARQAEATYNYRVSWDEHGTSWSLHV